MIFISLTRLRIRSLFSMPAFFIRNEGAIRQIVRTPGFLNGKLFVDAHRSFWTITAWEDEAAMRAYRNSGAHREAMPKLLDWCDEATVAHWTQETPDFITWEEAHERLIRDGKWTKVKRPSAAHLARKIAEPIKTRRLERPLSPKAEQLGHRKKN